MRWWSALFAVALLIPVPVIAQDAPVLGEPFRVLDDETGDYYAELRDGPGIQDPIPYYTFMDMDWLEVTELEDAFTFTIKVVDIEGPLDQVSFSDGGFFWIHFRHNDWDYQLQIERPSGQTTIEYFAVLQSKFMDADEWGFLWRDDEGVTFDMDAATISYTVSREDLADSRGAAPYPGRSLVDFWVIASQRSSRAESNFMEQQLRFPWQLQDRMPDTGIGDVAMPILSGIAQTGNAQLSSNEPFRASNGEATTFLYTVNARNTGDKTDLFNVEAVNVPQGWDVQLPLAGFELAGGEDLAIPVLLSTPFAHLHGGSQQFLLEMTSTSNSQSVGRVELGVRYLEIPQPAGHHDAVYLHSIANTQTASFNSVFEAAFQPSGSPYFNTWEKDESSDNVAVSAYGGVGAADFVWLIPLDPTLRMGLDFDMESLGEAQFSITSPGPLDAGELSGAFVLRKAGGGFQSIMDAPQLATFSDSGRAWSPGQKHTFQLDITPQPAGDYIPYDASNELWLFIEMTGTGVSAFNQNTVPKLEPDGWFQLPLLEYEDDISDAFDALSGARLVATSPATRDANPGDVVLFDVDVSAYDAAVGDYELSLIGENKAWASIVTDKAFTVGTDATPTVVMVQVPLTADDGDRADLFLQAIHKTEPQRRGLIRLVVDVDTDQEWDDDSFSAVQYLDDTTRETPGPSLLAILGFIGIALLARRRQHS